MADEGRQFVVVAYDVTDDKRRARLAKALGGFGSRMEESVFEAWLTREEIDELEAAVRDEVELDVDLVRLYVLCRECVDRTRSLGCRAPSDPVVVVV